MLNKYIIRSRISEAKFREIIPNPILNSSFKQSIFEEKLRQRMQEAVGFASKFFK